MTKFEPINSPELSIIKDIFNELSYLQLDVNLAYIVESYIYANIKKYYSPESTDEFNITCNYRVRFDKKDGKFQSWNKDNITKMEECFYINDKLNGIYKRWGENGNILIESNYSDGKKNGLYINWWFSGNNKKYIECSYLNDILHQEYKKWNSDGILIQNLIYQDGKIINTLLPTE